MLVYGVKFSDPARDYSYHQSGLFESVEAAKSYINTTLHEDDEVLPSTIHWTSEREAQFRIVDSDRTMYYFIVTFHLGEE